MQCKKCGAELPHDAEFCYQCGMRLKEPTALNINSDYVEMRFNKKMFIISVISLGLLILFLATGLIDGTSEKASENKPVENNDEVVTETVEQEGMDPYEGYEKFTLTGRYVVGEDEELPPGIYDIQPNEEVSSLVEIKIDMGDYVDELEEYGIYGYKLKKGYIITTDGDGAVFIKVRDIGNSNTEQKDAVKESSPEGKQAYLYEARLTGTYVVGEDEELPPGIYDIDPNKTAGVQLTVDTGNNTEEYHNFGISGYKLKEGYVITTGEGGAFFKKAKEIE